MAQADTAGGAFGSGGLLGSWLSYLKSSVGTKVVMAVTGLGLWFFIMAHLAGNLLLYVGRDAFNAYAEALHSKPELLWIARLGLIAIIPAHFVTAYATWLQNKSARPIAYAAPPKARTTLAAKTMVISGSVILFYLVFHLAHFTWRVVGPMPSTSATGAFDTYGMVVLGFQNPLITLLYVVGQLLLAAHLSHGIFSLFQHLGIAGSNFTPFIKKAATLLGYGICLIFASIPVAVFVGVIRP
jgi:succinate dehydrogenase / fumarate reductase, cytochrome b subunit